MERLIQGSISERQASDTKKTIDHLLSEHVANLPEKIKKKFMDNIYNDSKEDSEYISWLKNIVRGFQKAYGEWPSEVLKAKMGEN